jgi:general stress protein YciG
MSTIDGANDKDKPAATNAGSGSQPRKPRGFAAMDRRLVSEIARKGGRAAHAAGTAHEFTSEEARLAGGKGGRATHENRRRMNMQRAQATHPGGPDVHS